MKSRRKLKAGASTVEQEERLVHEILAQLDELGVGAGKKAQVASIKRNVKKLQDKLSESNFKIKYNESRRQALQKFIDDFPSMLGYWNRDLVNVHSNKVYAEYFGQTPSEIRGKHIKDLLGGAIFKMNKPHITAALQGIPQTFERAIPTPTGKVRHTLATYVPHKVDNAVAGFFVVVTDISEKKDLEEKAKHLESALHEKAKLFSLGQMASGIAHEINNPMTIIYSNACLMLSDLEKANIKNKNLVRRATEIKETSLRIESIIDGLRMISRGEE